MIGERLVGLALAALAGAGRVYGAAGPRARAVIERVLAPIVRRLGGRPAVVEENLARAYPADPAARARVRSGFPRHLARLGCEVALLLGDRGRALRAFVQAEVELVGAEHWRAARAGGKGVLFLSSHVGNWEVMAAAGAIHGGMDLLLVTKRLSPPVLHARVEEARAACGVRATYEPRTLRDALAHLGRGGTVGFVLDQYAGPPVGVRVPFFGVPVGTPQVVASLARRTGAPVIPVVNYRVPGGKWRVVIGPALAWLPDPEGDRDRELALNTAEYARVIERDVREHPEQWLWSHRRFKGDLSALGVDEWARGRTRV